MTYNNYSFSYKMIISLDKNDQRTYGRNIGESLTYLPIKYDEVKECYDEERIFENKMTIFRKIDMCQEKFGEITNEEVQ